MRPKTIFQKNDFRIQETQELDPDIEGLKGDTYNLKVNPEIDPKRMREEELDFERSIEEFGVFGYTLEKWNPEVGKGWTHVDSCFGFVGSFDASEERFNHDIVEELKGQIPKESQ